MIRTLLVVVSFLPLMAVAQSIWTKSNPVWHYDYWNVAEQGFIRIEQQDSVLHDGHWCDHLVATKYRFFYTGPPPSPMAYNTENYIGGDVYVSNDTVYYWDLDHFSVLYNFGAQSGENWLLQNGQNLTNDFQCNDSSYVVVDDVSSVLLNSETAVFMNVHDSVGNGYGIQGPINSRFGAMGGNYLFPFMHNCNPNIVVDFDILTFKCFQDDSLDYNPSGEDCEYLLTHLGVDDESHVRFDVYPNPSPDFFFISNLENNAIVSVVDVFGKAIATYKNEKGALIIDASKWANGIYLLTIDTAVGQVQKTILKK
ncbi:MAG: T9SS type A sorting domain-containing protein [Fluviicola sp.]|nr:T9SS type A sorting domain-containing protein [Fluviicola sp.]